ncbi:GNAT family N-acetyltransferase, partial [Craurococcus roseus]
AAGAPAVRRLGRADMPAVERHLLALGPADRRKRFLLPADDAAIGAFVARLDPGRAVVVGAMAPDGPAVGVAEARPVAGMARGTVEVAVSVHPYHRREGIGRRLVARAVSIAFAEGADAAVLLFAPENRAMARLADALGARSTALGGALLVEATLDRRGGAALAA